MTAPGYCPYCGAHPTATCRHDVSTEPACSCCGEPSPVEIDFCAACDPCRETDVSTPCLRTPHVVEWALGPVEPHATHEAALAAVRVMYPDVETTRDGARTVCWEDAEQAANDDGWGSVAVIRGGTT